MARIGVVICSRTKSERLPAKAHINLNGKPVLRHLLDRIEPIKSHGISIHVAIPSEDAMDYEAYHEGWTGFHSHDPLKRMLRAAEVFSLDYVIRITHDKILVSPDHILQAVEMIGDHDYLAITGLPPGCGFEIIKTDALVRASRFNNVEHISYAVRSVANSVHLPKLGSLLPNHRFLIDYKEDIQFFNILFSALGNSATHEQIAKYIHDNEWIKKVNRLPLVSIYTCVKNGEAHIANAMRSVAIQKLFSKCEYIIVDDHSTDKTTEIVARWCMSRANTRWIRNPVNIGLASSSNVALKNARGKYILRLDADDYFVTDTVIQEMYSFMESSDFEAVYPDNYFGKLSEVQSGCVNHHVGGAMFQTSAINYVKFTDGLKGYEGLDLFIRAKDQLKIGYIQKPMFMYTQRPGSMSKSNLEERAVIKEGILANAKA